MRYQARNNLIMDFNLNRFVEEQDNGSAFANALQEIENGLKTSHWMWFVFPQIKGLGRSPMSKKYAISSLYEAYAYMNNAKTRDRLFEATRVMNECNYGRDIVDVLDSTLDAAKFRSSMTLFDLVEPHSEFDRALEIFFDGERDDKTLKLIAEELNKFQDDPFEKFNISKSIKAYFDDGCHEATELTDEDERLATFLDFKKRGYSLVQLCRNYLISHNDLLDSYRTHNLEFTLSNLASQTIEKAFVFLDKKNETMKLIQFFSLFPESYFLHDDDSDWETIAFRVESLFDFILKDDILSQLADSLISEHSSIKNINIANGTV